MKIEFFVIIVLCDNLSKSYVEYSIYLSWYLTELLYLYLKTLALRVILDRS